VSPLFHCPRQRELPVPIERTRCRGRLVLVFEIYADRVESGRTRGLIENACMVLVQEVRSRATVGKPSKRIEWQRICDEMRATASKKRV
jgi:hypothetical protein